MFDDRDAEGAAGRVLSGREWQESDVGGGVGGEAGEGADDAGDAALRRSDEHGVAVGGERDGHGEIGHGPAAGRGEIEDDIRGHDVREDRREGVGGHLKSWNRKFVRGR